MNVGSRYLKAFSHLEMNLGQQGFLAVQKTGKVVSLYITHSQFCSLMWNGIDINFNMDFESGPVLMDKFPYFQKVLLFMILLNLCDTNENIYRCQFLAII